MNELDRYQSAPVVAEQPRAKRMSARMFNLTVSGLIFIGFCVMALGSYATSTLAFYKLFASSGLGLILGMFAGSIAGLIMMSVAAGRQSAGLSIAGFALFVSSFGLTASIGLAMYDLPTINTAFAATAGITLVFGTLGMLFPSFFSKAMGVVTGCLFGVIIVELVLMFMGVPQTVLDYAVVAIFAFFIAFDTYKATQVEPTLPNAVLAASNLFVDIVNVFLRILDIIGRKN